MKVLGHDQLKNTPRLMSIFKNTQNTPATLQFFAIFEKERPIKVLPRILSFTYMTPEQMGSLPLAKALSGNIMVPRNLPPWSEISENADILFLALQSRKSWGDSIKEGINLLKVETIRGVVLSMEESLNNFSFRKDYLSGKFEPITEMERGDLTQERPKGKGYTPEIQEGPIPGENWV